MPIWLCEQALHSALPDLELPPGNRLQTDPMSLAEAMSTAGFADVRLQKLDLSVEVGSPRGAWDVMSAGMASLLSRLPDEQVGAVRDTFDAEVLERYGPNVTKLPVEIIVGPVVGLLSSENRSSGDHVLPRVRWREEDQ